MKFTYSYFYLSDVKDRSNLENGGEINVSPYFKCLGYKCDVLPIYGENNS